MNSNISSDFHSWLRSGSLATEAVGGWPKQVVGPSPIAWNEDHATPKELSKADIEDLKKAWGAAVKRALECGFDTIEIHNAHVCVVVLAECNLLMTPR